MSRPRSPIAERFEKMYIKLDSGCWQWQRTLDRHGYGRFSIHRTLTPLAHRFSYELFVGPIPAGLELDHLCRNRACINPSHLEPVTQSENKRRQAQVRWDTGFCRNGHDLAEVGIATASDGTKRCQGCRRASRARWRAKNSRNTDALSV